MKSRSSNELSLKEAVEELLDVYRLTGKLNETRLMGHWNTVVGKLIADHTRNLFIKNKKLFVSIDSSVIRNELRYKKEFLIQNLNRKSGLEVIDDIIFK